MAMKKNAPAKKPKTDPSDPIRYQLTPSGQKIVSNFRNQPPAPPPKPVKISTTPKPVSAKNAKANAKAINKFNKSYAKNPMPKQSGLGNNRPPAKVNFGSTGGAGASRGSGSNMGHGNMGGGLRRGSK
jgi:hypothetical protein